jgi:hypothetical protein
VQDAVTTFVLIFFSIAIFLVPVLFFEINLLLPSQKVFPFSDVFKNVKKNMTFAEFDKMISKGAQLVLLDGNVLDVKDFLQFHPGGQFVITKRIGYDITD